MTITRKITAMTTAAALAATAMVPLATTASAAGWRDGHRGERHAYARSERRDWKRGKRHGYRHHRRHKRDNTGKYIAIGVGALMLGIIASEAARH